MDSRDHDDGLKMPIVRKDNGSNANKRPSANGGVNPNTRPGGGYAKPAGQNSRPRGSSPKLSGEAYRGSANKKQSGSGDATRNNFMGGYPEGGSKRPNGAADYSCTDGAAKTPKTEKRNRYRSVIKALIALFCVLVVGVVAIGIYFVSRWKDNDYSSLQPESVVVLAPGTQEAPQQSEQPQLMLPGSDSGSDDASAIVYNGQTYIKNKNVVNLLFLGIDTNADRKKNMKGYRSDMLMVCAVDIAEKKATLISIPRDTYTTVYKIDKETGQIKETLQDKINTAYSYGGGAEKYSYPNAMACVEMFLERRCELQKPLDFELDIPVYLYAGVDMDGISHVATAVGGVDVTLKQSVPKVGSKGQTVTLKYENAFEFLSNRHDTDGDTHRAARQQQFMIALAKKIKSMGPVDMILSLYDELQKYVWTNLNTDQMIDFAKILTKVNIDSIEMCIITGEGETTDSYHILHDEDATLELLLDVYYTKAS